MYLLGNACIVSENVIFNHPVKNTRITNVSPKSTNIDGVAEAFNVLNVQAAISSHVYICQFDG